MYLIAHYSVMWAGCSLGRGESGCGTRSHFSAECGTINVTRGPDSDGGDICEWTIVVQDGHIANVTIEQFHMADTGKERSITYFCSETSNIGLEQTWIKIRSSICFLKYLELSNTFVKNFRIIKSFLNPFFQIHFNYSSNYFAAWRSLAVITLFRQQEYNAAWHVTFVI